MAKVRADLLLVAQGLLAESRPRTATVDHKPARCFAEKSASISLGISLNDDAQLRVTGDDNPFVSRGGLKLRSALRAFAYDPSGYVAADFGASTGGFTDCLLQNGAVKVYAIDVGYGQLHQRLREDERVVVMERTNARHLDETSLPELVDIVVIDASFIGADKLLPAARAVLKPNGDVLVMVKPQFQVGKDRVEKGGVIRDEGLRREAIEMVKNSAEALGMLTVGEADSELKGPKGNQETFLWIKRD
ncbi:MAG: TlyA family RNA methyltransferase [Polyangiales bacterium]